MKVRWLSIALIFSLLVGAVGAPASVQSQTPGLAVDVKAGAVNGQGVTNTFNGTLTVANFGKQGASLVADVVLDGEVNDLNSTVIGNIRRFAAPVTAVKASCEKLDLELEKLDMQAPGFDIKLDKVAIAFNIKDHPDKKVGKLLCNLAKKLENGNPPSAVANELNHLLREISR